MLLSEAAERSFEDLGFLPIPGALSEREVDELNDAQHHTADLDPAMFSFEPSGALRGIHGAHKTIEAYRRICRHPTLVRAAERLLGSRVYVHQFKLNIKCAFLGEAWAWHQDYYFWRVEDGLPSARALSVALFLDPVSAKNGPLLVMPGSHRGPTHEATRREPPEGEPTWLATLGADLKYNLPIELLRDTASQYGVYAATGDVGTALFFHSNLLHASGSNVSDVDRRLLIVSYNSMENLPTRPSVRPPFLAENQPSAVTPWDVDTAGDDEPA